MDKINQSWREKYKNVFVYVIAACFIIAFYCLIMNITEVANAVDKVWKVLSPFVFGAVLAYLLRPCCNIMSRFLKKIKWMRKAPNLVNFISVIISLCFGLGLIVLLCFAVIPPLLESISDLLLTLPDIGQNIVTYVQTLAEEHETIQTIVSELYARADMLFKTEIMPSVTDIVDVISNSALGVIDLLKTVFIGIIAAVYLLADKHNIKRRIVKAIDKCCKKSTAKLIKEELRFADKTMTRYIIGTCLDALLVGVVTYVFSLITKLPSPMLLAATIAATNVIPIVGPFIGAIPTALLVLAYAPDKFLMYCIYLLILQQIDGHILVPKVLGSAVGISGLTALFAIVVGGGLFGIPGMILGVPVVTVIIDLVKRVIEFRKNKIENQDESLCTKNEEMS